jgi:cytochrome P450
VYRPKRQLARISTCRSLATGIKRIAFDTTKACGLAPRREDCNIGVGRQAAAVTIMDACVPPFPARPSKALNPVELLVRGRRDFLSIWTDKAFEYELMSTRMFAKRIWICNSPDTVRHAFIAAHGSFECKSPQMRTALRPLLGDGLFVSDGETWRLRRRLVAPIVHASRLPLFAPIFVEAALEARERWSGLAEIDVLSEMARLTAEVICRTLFGRALGQSRAQDIVEGFSDYQRHVGQTDLLSLLGLPNWLPRLHGPAQRAAAKRVTDAINEILEVHVAHKEQRDDSVIGALLTATNEDGRLLDRAAVRNEVATLFMAGHETTANTLSWAWYLLSQSPRVEAELHAELDRTLGDRPPNLADLPNLPYTRAIIDETLRLYPPVPLLAREAGRDEALRGRKVSAGSLIIVVPWLLHRHRKYWTDPDSFIPERFLPGAPAPDKYVYVPFSLGPRVCPGLSLGLTEAVLCLAALAQAFELRLREGTVVEPVCRLTLRPGSVLPMTIRRRSKKSSSPSGADQGSVSVG